MTINVFFDENGVSIIDVLAEDFLSFLDEYIKTKLSERDSY